MRNYWKSLGIRNPFKGGQVKNFRRTAEVWGDNLLFQVKIDKNNAVYEVVCGSFGSTKRGRRYFVNTPTRHLDLFQKIKGRQFDNLCREIILRYDIIPADEE